MEHLESSAETYTQNYFQTHIFLVSYSLRILFSTRKLPTVRKALTPHPLGHEFKLETLVRLE